MRLVNRPRTAFERTALASGLLTQEQLDEALAALVPAADRATGQLEVALGEEQLVEKLVEMGRLNLWQAKQLRDGRTRFTLGPYRIIDSLGRGGMGQVFKGEHQVLGRIVAIKVLPREKSTEEAVSNFRREIRAQARLDHPNLVRALDAGEDASVHFLVTEYVPGSDLRKLVRRKGPLTMQAAASIVSQAAAGLQHAHARGIIHRDIKPGNVLVTPDGHAKVSDLGLAGWLEGTGEEDPRLGKIVGTADYVSPDHIRFPWEPTPAWDIYSLGCTLYYAVTGKVPFPRGTTADKVRAHLERQPIDPRRLNHKLDAAFVEVMAEMLAKDPAERIPTAADVMARLAPWTVSPDAMAIGLHPVEAPRSVGSPDQETQDDLPEAMDDAAVAPPGWTGSQTQGLVRSPLSKRIPRQPEPKLSEPEEPPDMLAPLVFLVLLPAGFIATMALVWWLVAGG